MLTTSEITDVMYQLFVLAAQLAGPVLIISMIVGIIISLIQAATQIHEQTLTFLPKLVVIGVILVINGSNMLRAMQDFTKQVFEMIAR
jgi:flagellar biosynthetic protein FliQ